MRAAAAEGKIKPSFYDVAARADSAHRVEALRLAEGAAMAANQAQIIDRYRDIVNFVYWRSRCELEQTPDALDARRLTYEADAAFRMSDLPQAKEKYDQAFGKWAALLEAYPTFKDESTYVGDIKDIVDRYRKLLDQLDLKLPDDFILKHLIEQPQIPQAPAEGESKDVTSDPSQPEGSKKPGGSDESGPPE